MDLAIASFLHIAAATFIARLEIAHMSRTDLTPVQHWLHEELFHPLLRAAALLLFMVIAWRGIFGLAAAAPGMLAILDFELVSRGINLLFILPFLLALLPNSAIFTPLLLPLQTVALTGVVFLHIARRMEASVTLLPGMSTLPALILLAVAGHLLARHLGRWLPAAWNSRLQAYDLGLLVFQLPLMIVYGRMLGSQLAA